MSTHAWQVLVAVVSIVSFAASIAMTASKGGTTAAERSTAAIASVLTTLLFQYALFRAGAYSTVFGGP